MVSLIINKASVWFFASLLVCFYELLVLSHIVLWEFLKDLKDE